MDWRTPPQALAIADDEIHLWVAIQSEAPPGDALVSSLAQGELARAQRLLRRPDRELFILAHAMLRDVLARYLRITPGAIMLSSGAQGKPRLAELHHSKLRFNLAHSGQAVLCGVAQGREIGVDIEASVPREDLRSIAAHFFAPDECAALAVRTVSEQAEFFYLLWTRKEAYVKARGTGLNLPLHEFSVLPAMGAPSDAVIRCLDTAAQTDWYCSDLPAPQGYAAATVVAGSGCTLSRWRWPGMLST